MKGTLGWQLVSVVVGQLQSRRVFGRKGNVTAMVTVFHVRTCQILVHVNYKHYSDSLTGVPQPV